MSPQDVQKQTQLNLSQSVLKSWNFSLAYCDEVSSSLKIALYTYHLDDNSFEIIHSFDSVSYFAYTFNRKRT